MSRKVLSLYEWQGQPGNGSLRRVGIISEAKLRAWEYEVASDDGSFEFDAGTHREVVSHWKPQHPELRVPDLWVGDCEEVLLESIE